MESKVKCSICQLICTGREANEHKTSTGHNDWELLMGERTMGREIKFRAMNYVSHTWWYGSNQVDRIDYATNTMPIRTFWRWFAENALDPKTLSQYTGLKDKNGLTELYEGDVVKFPYNRKDIITPVCWGTDGWWAKLPGWFKTLYWVADKCEVIGNIYENPELIKEGE